MPRGFNSTKIDTILLAKRLSVARNELGLTLAQAGARSGLHLNTIHRAERGDAEPSLSTYLLLCAAYELPTDLLVTNCYEVPRSKVIIKPYGGLINRLKTIFNIS